MYLRPKYPFVPFEIFGYCMASSFIQKINSLLSSSGSEGGPGRWKSP